MRFLATPAAYVELRNSTGSRILIGQSCRIGKKTLYGKYGRAVLPGTTAMVGAIVLAMESVAPNKRGRFCLLMEKTR